MKQAADPRGANWVVLDDFLRQEQENFDKVSCHLELFSAERCGQHSAASLKLDSGAVSADPQKARVAFS